MRTTILGILVATLALPVFASAARAHGGQYRGPGGALPPNLREPHDPTPPSPPPPSTPPTTDPSTPTDPGRAPDPVTPGGTPTPPSSDPLGGGATRPSRNATITPDSWVFWYEYNKDRLQQLKRGIYTFRGSNHPFGPMSNAGAGARSAQRHGTRAAVRAQVIPALLWAMDPQHSRHQDTESAAYLALAKVTDDPVHVELIQKGLQSKNLITRESAALALGLLRREETADQFDAATLDRVRAFLFDVFTDEGHQARTRGFAALAIGLLGDQPAGGDNRPGASATTARLFELLRRSYAHEDLPVALLVAISLQGRDTLVPAQFDLLRACVAKRRIDKNEVSAFVASYAAMALGRIGDRAKDVHVMLRALGTRRTPANVARSAAIAVGKLGRRCSPEDRIKIAQQLRSGIESKRIRDVTARCFAVMSLAYLLEADVAADSTEVLERGKVGEFLMDVAEGGTYALRPYGALALGLACRAITQETTIPVYGEFQSRAREALRNGLMSKKTSKRGRGAYAIALGLAQDQASIPDLTGLVGDEKEDDELRGYASVALGHIGVGSERVLEPIRRALVRRRSEKLRRATASALGMLGDRKAVPILLDELARARSQSAKGQVVVALAKVGDERAIQPLIEVLRDAQQQDLTRALACAGLGIIGDIAWVPSLSRIGEDINYRASGDMINEVLSIL